MKINSAVTNQNFWQIILAGKALNSVVYEAAKF